MVDSRAFRLLTRASRVLRYFPMVFLAAALVCAGLAVRDFFFQTADQLVTVNVALVGRK